MTTNYDNLIEDDLDSPIQEGFLDDDMDIPLISSIQIRDESTSNCTTLCPLQQNHPSHMNFSNSNDESKKAKGKMILAAILCFIFMVTEFIGGYIAGSLAIMTDAAHLTSDCVSFLIGIASIWISKKPPDHIMSFGYKRIEIFGAVTSILAIWFLTIFLVYLAVARIVTNDYNINANSMMIASSIGICMNISMAITLHGSCFPGLHSHSHKNFSNNSNCSNIPKSKCRNVNNSSGSSNYLNCVDQQQTATTVDVDIETPIFVATFNPTPATSGINYSSSTQNSYDKNQNRGNSLNMTRVENHTIRNDLRDIVLTEISPNSQHHNQNQRNLNLRAAIIHVIGDFIQSIGVFIASIVIKLKPDAKIADPICTIFFSFLVILTTIKIMKESVHVLLDAVPSSISMKNIENDLKNFEGIKSVHQLNVWSLSVNHNILTVHLIIDDIVDSETILKFATNLLKTKYNIKETTIQIEQIQNNDN